MTNDSGCGIFRGDGSQITGNGQFCGGEKALLRWLNSDSDMTDERYFKSKTYAEKYAAKKSLEDPIRKMPVEIFDTKKTASFMGYDVKIVSQDNETVQCEYLDEPGHTFTTEYYNLIQF